MLLSLTASVIIALTSLKVPRPLWEPLCKTFLLSSRVNWKQNHSYAFWVLLLHCFFFQWGSLKIVFLLVKTSGLIWVTCRRQFRERLDLPPRTLSVYIPDLKLKPLGRWNDQYLSRQLSAVVHKKTQRPTNKQTKNPTLILSQTRPQVKINAIATSWQCLYENKLNVCCQVISAGLQVKRFLQISYQLWNKTEEVKKG